MRKIILVMVLAITFLSSIGFVASENVESSDFDDPSVCGGCHSEIYNQWNGSLHSVAYTDPLYLKLEEIASDETDGLTDDYCTRCHTPIGVLSGEVPPIGLDNPALSEVSEKGVSCDFCHSVNGSTGIGNGAFTVSPDGIKRGPHEDSKSPYHETAFSDLHTKAEFCGMCHDVYHPVNGHPIETTYTEWKEGPYNTGDKETTTYCQDCHMTPGITQFEANPGRSTSIGPEREHIYTHYFVGGNAAVPGLLGSDVHKKMAEERLKSAAKLELEVPDAIAGEEAEIRVSVTNVGAGHKLPTGLTEAREAWIEVVATDSSGKEIFHIGGLDEDGNVDHEAVIYHTVLADANGDPTHKVWEVESTISDNRIPPKETKVETYRFAIPADAEIPITVETKFNYRSASQELLDTLMGEGAVVAPVIEMASATETIGPEDGGGETPGFEIAIALIGLLSVAYFVRRKGSN
ncbi:MAG: PGF-CTERM sorting domain-containing protein [Halobacteriota archaeon]|nr:PGF-CTERM sorting domain-containing protein [Halobacteriota archaeon]